MHPLAGIVAALRQTGRPLVVLGCDSGEGVPRGVKRKVHVTVDQPWHESAIAQIDDLCSRGTFDCRTDFDDAIPLDKNLAWLDQFAGLDVEQPGGMQHHRMSCRGGRLPDGIRGQNQRAADCQK